MITKKISIMKTKILLLITIVAFLTACESNDNSDINITNEDLVGEWNVTAQTLDITTTGNFQGIALTSKTTGYGKDFDFTYTFSKNPNIVAVKGKYTSVTTTSILGQPDNTQEIEVHSVDGFDSGTWNLSGNTISITDSSNLTGIADVIEFTGNRIKLQLTINETESINGANVSVSGEMFLTLEK